MPTYTGNNNDNHINGSNGDDIIYGLGGDDELRGKKGNDDIFGGSGHDEIHGDEGHDDLFGETGNDFLFGDSGNDRLYGGDGHDLLSGGDGNDELTGGGGLDALDGGAGFDRAFYSGAISEYDFYTAFGLLAVVHQDGAGADGADLLHDVEQLVFADATITIGANNAPVAVDDSAATDEDAGVYSSGAASVTDNDFDFEGDALTVTPGSFAGTYGTLDLAADGTYTYTLNANAQTLGAGQLVQDSFSYTVSDGSLNDTGTLTINVAGVNDAPAIDAGGTDASGSVTELAESDPDENAFTHQESGTIAFDDVDAPDTHNASFTPQGVGYVGTFTLDPVNQAGDTVGWDFSVEDADIDFLAAGEVLVQTYTVQVSDGNGGFATQDVTITLTGAGEVDLTGVWFIDNSAVGSFNLGTQDDPFLSIADFNAAQGTVGGPETGDTIYLREGLGTYAEGDGIDLLDGQILIGGGDDLVVSGETVETATGRPTIVVTGPGNHGVELAMDNSLSGFDIGDTTGAGIADGGGTVGALSVSNLAKSGAGQIVDIDAGGNVAISLDSAGSTGSTGGAIDLAGVSGSFTVLGATNITGSHAGGGVVVSTGNALQVTFAGGGLVSTGADDGVSVSTSGGGLVLDNGFDIVTTSGDALTASLGGGDIAIMGAGNNIASTTGAAVFIADAVSLGVTLESVSSAGGSAPGILLSSLSGAGFTVTGVGTLAGSGGTISGKTGADGSFDGNGVVLVAAANVSLANMAITGAANFGIRGDDVDGFTLRDSIVTGHGTSLSEGAVSFAGLTGTALLEGNLIAGGSGDNMRVLNSAGTLDLIVRDSVANAAIFGHNALGGEDSLHIETDGSAALTLTVDGVEFQGARSDLLLVAALGSSTQDIEVRDSQFHNSHANVVAGGGGVLLTGGGDGSNIAVDFLIEGSSFRGADGNALSAAYTHDDGAIQGRIEGNVIGIGDAIAGSEGSVSGVGLFVDLEQDSVAGNSSFAVAIVDNEIYDVGGFAAVNVSVSGGGAGNPAIMEAEISGNTIAELGEFAFTAFYALVGGSDFSGDFSRLGLDMEDNVIDASGALFGENAVYLDQLSEDANYYFPGYGGSSEGEFAATPGTASTDLDLFLLGQGNVMLNGGFASFPLGGVNAGFVTGVTGDPFGLAPWAP